MTSSVDEPTPIGAAVDDVLQSSVIRFLSRNPQLLQVATARVAQLFIQDQGAPYSMTLFYRVSQAINAARGRDDAPVRVMSPYAEGSAGDTLIGPLSIAGNGGGGPDNQWYAVVADLQRMPDTYSKGLALWTWAVVTELVFGVAHERPTARVDALGPRAAAEQTLLLAMGSLQAPYPQLLDRALYTQELNRRLVDYYNVNSTGRDTPIGRSPGTVWAELASFLSMRLVPVEQFVAPPSMFSASRERVPQTRDFDPYAYGQSAVRQAIALGELITKTAASNVAQAGKNPNIRHADQAPWFYGGNRRLRLGDVAPQ